MGTSVSHPSPNTLPWNAVAAAYRDERVPVDRVLREIWRAARKEPEIDVRDLLSSDGVRACLHVALRADTPARAAGQAIEVLAREHIGSIGADIARRAAVVSVTEGDRLAVFATNLFVQMTDYLVSRDLPGHIGERWRNKTVSEARAFKDQLRSQTAEIVGAQPPDSVPHDQASWREYVHAAVERLAT